jgi:nitrite reductase (NADH) small subunit
MNVATSNVATSNWVLIGTLSDIPRQGARRVKAGQATIAIFRTDDDRVFAVEDKCPHKEGPLSQGIVHGDCVTCPLHNWVISLETGKAQGADEGTVRTFALKRDGESIFMDASSIRTAGED